MFASLAKPDDDTELHWLKVRCLFLLHALPIASASPPPPYSHHRISVSFWLLVQDIAIRLQVELT